MYGRYARRYQRRKVAQIKKTVKRRLPIKKVNMVRLIKNVVNKQAEAKIFVVNAQMVPTVTSAGTPTPNGGSFIDFTPTIANGNEQGQRVGNKLSIRSCIIRGSVMYAYESQNMQPVPCYLEIILFRLKRTTDLPTATDWLNLLDNGQTNDAYNSSSLQPLTLTVNNELFTIYKRLRFKIGNSVPVSGTALTNNDFSFCKTFKVNITKYFKNRTILFDDSTPGNDPQNCPLYCASFIVPVPVGVTPITGQFPIVEASVEWHYTDS